MLLNDCDYPSYMLVLLRISCTYNKYSYEPRAYKESCVKTEEKISRGWLWSWSHLYPLLLYVGLCLSHLFVCLSIMSTICFLRGYIIQECIGTCYFLLLFNNLTLSFIHICKVYFIAELVFQSIYCFLISASWYFITKLYFKIMKSQAKMEI